MEYLNGESLYGAFLSGAKEIIKHKEILNKINVFPVADGDTGNNLAATVSVIIEDAKVLDVAKSTMDSIAGAVLMGARGNSGIIFAQFINGISMGLKDKKEYSTLDFAESVKQAYPYVHNSISNPVEGTIITVIREWSEDVFLQKDKAKNFYELLEKPLDTALKSLEETMFKLKILEKSKVVDSGAKGFVYFIQGFTDFIKHGGRASLDLSYDKLDVIDNPVHQIQELTYRYCTEAVLSGNNLSTQGLKEKLEKMGDSLIVAGNENKARIHIHTNTPHEVMKILNQEGVILQQKADDMKRQYQRQYEKKYKIALVTDSIADLPEEILDQYQINRVPLNLMMNDTSYLDKVTMIPETFYEELDQSHQYPSSSQPSPRIIQELYASLIDHYDEILVITVAKEQSGTYNVFLKAAEQFLGNGKRIKVVDSKQNSGAQGLLVLKAAELIAQSVGLDQIVEEIEGLRNRTKILVSVKTLQYMVKSGRLSKLEGFVGKVSNLKPVVSLDDKGKGKIEASAFSLKSNTKKILDIIEKSHAGQNITRYSILHANDPVRAEEYKKKCLDILNKEPEYIMNISTIVGMSAGVGSVAVAYMIEGDEND